MSQHNQKIYRVGVAGLGGAAQMVLPYIVSTPGFALAGAADVRPDARETFTARHDRPAFDSVEALCASDDVDIVWIETPNAFHCAHAICAARAGKHVICAKPLATSLSECDRMIEAAQKAGVQLLQGHSKIFDAPIRAMRDVVGDGRIGRAIQVQIVLSNDWLQRPRLAEELDSAQGGGLVLRQGPHLVDMASYIIGAPPVRVSATTGRWDEAFDTEGNFSALLTYADGASASLIMNGYGHFDSAELHWGIGPMGSRRDFESEAPRSRTRRQGVVSAAEKYDLPVSAEAQARRAQGEYAPFFGLVLVWCERGMIRQSPKGLYVYDEMGRHEVEIAPYLGRAAELLEMREAIETGRTAFPDGIWARATLETCLAISNSAQRGLPVDLSSWAPGAE